MLTRFANVIYAGATQQQQTSTQGSNEAQPAREECTAKLTQTASKAKTTKRSKTRNALKRSRSVARGVAQPSTNPSDDDDASDEDEYRVKNITSRTFQIGDMKELKVFLRYRLDELTMKPIRPIVTAWIKQLEPRRLGDYGPYHKLLPAAAPSDATPPWWPEDVIYNEPSHLSKSGTLLSVCSIFHGD